MDGKTRGSRPMRPTQQVQQKWEIAVLDIDRPDVPLPPSRLQDNKNRYPA